MTSHMMLIYDKIHSFYEIFYYVSFVKCCLRLSHGPLGYMYSRCLNMCIFSVVQIKDSKIPEENTPTNFLELMCEVCTCVCESGSLWPHMSKCCIEFCFEFIKHISKLSFLVVLSDDL